jgi:indolepyruvate ferredoxin oxidoreductase alpha subunit
VVEELDPFLEEQLHLAGIRLDGGAELLPRYGELDPAMVAGKLHAAGVPGVAESLLTQPQAPVQGLPVRPPTLCPGCGHRGVFTVLSRLKLFVSGDIGCYTLGALPPFNAMNSDICMGASISTAHGIQKALGDLATEKGNRKVSVIGDSTFFHSGITGLLNIVWNGGTSVVIILDNRTTAMTGGQETPGTGKTLCGLDAPCLDLAEFCRALGVPRVEVVDPYDLKEVERAVTEAIAAQEPSVIVAQAPCVLQYRIRGEAWLWTKRPARAASAACAWVAPPSVWFRARPQTRKGKSPSMPRSVPVAGSVLRCAVSMPSARG